MTVGLEGRLTTLLAGGNASGGFPVSLVCTDKGLLVATAGAAEVHEVLAALASLFDDVVARASRDLGMAAVDELTLRDERLGRCVVRPLRGGGDTRMFLVVQVPPGASWRRTTNRLCQRLDGELAELLTPADMS